MRSNPVARVARAFAPWSSGRPTAEHAPRSADLAWLCCGPTRGALLPTPSVEARPHQHRDRSAAGISKGRSQRVRIPWRASRARIAPWSSGRRTAEHVPRSVDLAWLCCGPTRGALHPHAVGRGSTAPTPRQVGGTELRKVVVSAFESHGARPARVSHHGVAADGPRSTRRAARTWRGCVVGQRAARSIPTPSAEARPHQHRDRSAARRSRGFGHRVRIPWRAPARFARGVSADRPRSTRRAARTWRGCVVGQRGRAPPHAVGRGSTAPTPRQVGGRGFEGLGQRVRIPWRASRARIAPWSSGRRTAEHAPRSADLAWLCCGPTRGALSPHAVGRGSTAPTPRQVGGWASTVRDQRVRIPWRASRARIAPWSSGRPPAEHAPRSADLAWLCCGPTRGALHPHAVGRGSTAPTPRQVGGRELRKFVVSAFESRGARPARVSHHGVAADGRGARAAQRGLGVVVLWANSRRAPSPRRRPRLNRTNTATGRSTAFEIVWPARSNPVARARALSPMEYRPIARGARAAQRGLGVVVVWANAGALLPTPSAEARSHQHRDRSAAGASKVVDQRVRIPWRASRARIALWSSGRRASEHAPRSADLAWLWCGPTRGRAPSPLPSAEARPHQPPSKRQRIERS